MICTKVKKKNKKKTSTKNTGTNKINCPFAIEGKYPRQKQYIIYIYGPSKFYSNSLMIEILNEFHPYLSPSGAGKIIGVKSAHNYATSY
uniref:Uncharacterized protein n=1 Tax=Lactuca sativa TaxID=4236 RepID=A0A9R1X8R9_LACSA|nr:hypothetical protein LSAT_V11C500259540 [Lactuca sativa]